MTSETVARLPRVVTVLGVVFLGVGLVTQLVTFRLGVPLPRWELQFASDAEFLGVGLWWVAVATRLVAPRSLRRTPHEPPDTVHVTRGLVDALLARAADAEPARESLALGVTAAGDVDGERPDSPDVPVFTHLVHPDAGRSVRNVFGVDLATTPGRAPGRFVSHPRGSLSVSKRDDLREVVFVAVPPWDDDCLAAFDRSGRRLPLRVLDATPADTHRDLLSPTEVVA